MFARYLLYGVLICREHCCAVYGLDKHLKQHHSMSAAERKSLLASYKDFDVLPPAEVTQPAPYGPPIDALGPVQDAFLCCCCSNSHSSSRAKNRDSDSAVCNFISTSRAKMRQHVNQQHSVKLTRWLSPATASYKEHAAQLWQPVQVQTFFRERRYVRYFVVQVGEKEDEEEEQQQEQGQGEQEQNDEQQQNGKQQELERQGNYKQRLALLSSSLEALKREDSKAINRMAEEVSAKDRTGWFKRTQ
jgi:hypothetical protein